MIIYLIQLRIHHVKTQYSYLVSSLFCFSIGNSSGDIWEFIQFVDQPNQNDNSSGNGIREENKFIFIYVFFSAIDWSNNNSIYQTNNPNQIIRNMARELEESTVGPLQDTLLSQSNKNILRHE